MDLKDKVAVATCAARGIGLALTRASLDAGAKVVMADVDSAALAGAAQIVGGSRLLPMSFRSRRTGRIHECVTGRLWVG